VTQYPNVPLVTATAPHAAPPATIVPTNTPAADFAAAQLATLKVLSSVPLGSTEFNGEAEK